VIKRKAFVLKDRPTLKITAENVADYNEKVAAWAKKHGLALPEPLDGTNTLCSVGSTFITETDDGDGDVDDGTDQEVDDSGD
jgi:hypothetical protein